MSPVLEQVAGPPSHGSRQAEAAAAASLELIAAIARSPHGDRFALRGAWCLAAWLGRMPRPTAAIDLLDLHGSEDPLGALREASSVDRIPCLVPCCTRERMVAEKAALMVTYDPDHTRLQNFLDV